MGVGWGGVGGYSYPLKSEFCCLAHSNGPRFHVQLQNAKDEYCFRSEPLQQSIAYWFSSSHLLIDLGTGKGC